MKNSSLDLFDPRTAVMDSDYLSEGGRDGDFGFAFNGSNFSDRTLQIEIIAESPETRSDGEGCQSLADWARNQKRQKEEVDVWSAGVILYILLCGVPPFWAETEQGVALTILRGVVDFKREPWPQISDNAKSLVQQMLEPDPRKRLTTKQLKIWVLHL